LARLEYSLPRLRRAWTHLDRQRGGGVTQRGEGEAQIELDQRMLRDKISSTKKEIKQFRAVELQAARRGNEYL
jgi:GTP-binding protein HflX